MRPELARLLIEEGTAPATTVDGWVALATKQRSTLDTVVLEAGALSEGSMLGLLERASKLPAAWPEQFRQVDPKALLRMPGKLAEKHGIVPFAIDRRYLQVALVWPVEKRLLEELSFMLGRDLVAHVSTEVRVREAVGRLYKLPIPPRFISLSRLLGPAPRRPGAPRPGSRTSLSAAAIPAAPPAAPETPTARGPRTGREAIPAAPPAPPASEVAEPAAAPTHQTLPAFVAAPPEELPAMPPALEPGPIETLTAPRLEVVANDAEAALASPSLEAILTLPPAVTPPAEPRPVTQQAETVASTPAAHSDEEARPGTRPGAGALRGGLLDFSREEEPLDGLTHLLPPLHGEVDAASYIEPSGPQVMPLPPPPPPEIESVLALPLSAATEPRPPTNGGATWNPAPLLELAQAERVVAPAAVPGVPIPLVEAVSLRAASEGPSPFAPLEPLPLGATLGVNARSGPATGFASLAEEAVGLAEEARPPTPPSPPPPFIPAPPAVELPAPVVVLPVAALDVAAPVLAPPTPPAALPPAPPPQMTSWWAPPEEGAVPEVSPTLPGSPDFAGLLDDLDVPLPGGPLAPPPSTPMPGHLSGGEGALPRTMASVPDPVRPFLSWDVPETTSALEQALEGATVASDALEYVPATAEGLAALPELHTATGAAPDRPTTPSSPAPQPGSARPPTSPRPAPFPLSDARIALQSAGSREEVVEVVLRFARQAFEYVAVLGVRSGAATGFRARGPNGDDERVERAHILLDAPSVLRTVLRARGRYLGPLPGDPVTQQMLSDLGRLPPRAALIYPVLLRERPVAIVYADRGPRPIAADKVAAWLVFAQELPAALERAISHQKQVRNVSAVAVAPLLGGALPSIPGEAGVEDGPVAPPLPVEPGSFAGELLLAVAPDGTPSELAPAPSPVVVEAAPVAPPDDATIEGWVADLVRPDRKRRNAARNALLGHPELAATALAARFPGPTTFRRGLVGDLPDPDEIGPVASLLAQLRASAVPHVARLISEGNVDQRFFAALLAGSMPDVRLLGPLCTALVDAVPDVGGAARAAATRLRNHPEWSDRVLLPMRGFTTASEPDLLCAAARALAAFRDAASVPLLAPLTAHGDERVRAEASDALSWITKQTLGDSPRRWLDWWERHGTAPREAWLVEGLAHTEMQIRLASIGELTALTQDTFGYAATSPEGDRLEPLAAWRRWLHQRLGTP